MPAPHGLIERLAEMAGTGKPFVLVTLVETVGSAPQDAGTKMLVDAAGLRFGTTLAAMARASSRAARSQTIFMVFLAGSVDR